MAEIIYGASVTINLCAQIAYAKTSSLSTKRQIVPWIAEAFFWPEEVGLAFWTSVRNPAIHVGRGSELRSFLRWEDGPKVHVNVWLRAPSDAGKPPTRAAEIRDSRARGRGFSWKGFSEAGVPIDYSKSVIVLDFYIDEILDLLPEMRDMLRERIENATDEALANLEALNVNLPFLLTGDEIQELIDKYGLASPELGEPEQRSDS